MPVRRVYRGWWSVLALSATETVSFGILYYAFTVFVQPMARDLSLSVAVVAGAYSVGLVVAGFAADPVGRLLDRYGARWLMTGGSLVAGGLLIAWSFVQGAWSLYLVWFLLGIAMSLVLYEPAFAVLAVWFDAWRSRALTVLTFLAGFASVIFIPLAGVLVEAFDWRDALRMLAVILWVVTVPLHVLVLRRHPSDVGEVVDGGAPPPANVRKPARSLADSVPLDHATRMPAFWWLTIAFTVSTMVINALAVQLVPVLVLRGITPLEAAGIGGAIGIVAMPGRLVFTPLGAIVSRHAVAAAIFACQALGLLALWLLPSSVGLIAFVLLYGVGFGAITPARVALMVETFGPRAFASISGRSSMLGTVWRAIAPVALGALLDAQVDVSLALAILFAMLIAATLAVLMAGAATRPAGESPR